MLSTGKWIKLLCTTALLAECTGFAAAQNYQTPLYNDVLFLGNIYSSSANPTSISFAPITAFTDINVSYGLDRGDYHNIDQSSKVNHLGVEIKGLKKFSKAACYGRIGYYNGTEFERCWNSTLFISPDNPYILADSIESDFRNEIFTLQGIATYTPAENWILGIDLKYAVGSSSDQTDPRSETVGMRFSATPGITWQFAGLWSVGIAGNIELFKEKIEHTIINTQRSYTLLQFSGMGFNEGVSTNSTLGTSFTRNYTGLRYGGSLQLAYAGERIADLLEVSADMRNEDARDGGQLISFKGGDYDRTAFGITNRMSFHSQQLTHNLTLSATFKDVEGMWYTQELRTDPNKNNQEYYFTLDSATTHTEKGFEASVEYRMDIATSLTPELSWYIRGNLLQSKTKHFYYDTYYMNYTRLTLSAGIDKHFSIKKSLLSFAIQGEYALPLSNDDYKIYDRSTTEIDKNGVLVYKRYDKIPETYTYPRYEYESASYAAAGIKVSTHIPISTKAGRLWFGISAQTRAAFYLGDSVYKDLLGAELENPLKDTHLITGKIALDLLF